ncbi:hypothetical protein PHYPSEUDO_009806 [Phytophthora pseudosyringae]|uniref:Uncharacterized protein n=1 Tax=Phytophthora pseudosyringae TaxID=221518 RepID=A0A8T1VC51_9STRA|nr:hypothetical protein PHYPSEUDO_009806 [Phytophthora pseudosyringae]
MLRQKAFGGPKTQQHSGWDRQMSASRAMDLLVNADGAKQGTSTKLELPHFDDSKAIAGKLQHKQHSRRRCENTQRPSLPGPISAKLCVIRRILQSCAHSMQCSLCNASKQPTSFLR